MPGISAYGAYIPTARLSRQAVVDANAWFDAGLRALAKGQRSMCNWDEDVITMAVEAAQDCLALSDKGAVSTLYLASTTLPFLDRQNSVVVGEALGLGHRLHSMDITGSQRAATSALIALLESGSPNGTDRLLVAAEHRRSKAGSRQELLWGDGAAAVCVGQHNLLAEYLGSESRADDFVDHYRGEEAPFDYDWEERWIRDEGYLKLVPATVGALLGRLEIDPGQVNHFILASDQSRTPGAVARQVGIVDAAVVDNRIGDCGITGVAHPLLMLAGVLEQAREGELILLTGFGQGCDAIMLRATGAGRERRPRLGYSGALAQGRLDTNYPRFLAFNDLLERELGKRGETDKQTFLSGYQRRKDLLTGFTGGKCRRCGTVQVPRERYCVQPDCHALDSQDPYCFAGRRGVVRTWTADRLTFDWNPPAYFGMIEFEGGGRLMMDFTEVQQGQVDAGTSVTVHFRIKQIDHQRGFRKYFWKAVPVAGATD